MSIKIVCLDLEKQIKNRVMDLLVYLIGVLVSYFIGYINGSSQL